ncbi:hypothetical protein NIES267_68170 [Calothrix parasitica NIES-267]|uniref:Uncharacterized protein n=1 Tax=Calothrix parasitica NIES-267 TaxID=1973488 RepID=A0A1Z4M1E8_9CYAN|nr:hypothetical protein NIES267_68170 [Calothrix parasitica NIES-267]
MKYYHIYNLCIASELHFTQLIEIERKPDVNIRFGQVKDATTRQIENSKTVVGEIPEIGEFLIRDGK